MYRSPNFTWSRIRSLWYTHAIIHYKGHIGVLLCGKRAKWPVLAYLQVLFHIICTLSSISLVVLPQQLSEQGKSIFQMTPLTDLRNFIIPLTQKDGKFNSYFKSYVYLVILDQSVNININITFKNLLFSLFYIKRIFKDMSVIN